MKLNSIVPVAIVAVLLATSIVTGEAKPCYVACGGEAGKASSSATGETGGNSLSILFGAAGEAGKGGRGGDGGAGGPGGKGGSVTFQGGVDDFLKLMNKSKT